MPIITVSRLYGSGGSELARRVADSLGWSLLDNALIDAVAERLGVSREEVSKREERVSSLVERLADAMTLGTPEWVAVISDATPPPGDERLVEVTRRVVEEAVSQGPVVVVGRGAQAMLAARSDALHLFCYAPRAALIGAVMRRLSTGAPEADRLIAETHRQRDQYVRRHWQRDWLAMENYDLCLNTAALGLEAAAALTTRLARERFESSRQ
jgi:cytidylate kinase